MLDDTRVPHPAAVLHRVGRGQALYVPAALFRDFHHNRYPLTRVFVGDLLQRLLPQPDVRAQAPVCVDIVLRRRAGALIVHANNRASGIPNTPNNGAVDDIPAVGPITVRLRLDRPPRRVVLAFEPGTLDHEWQDGRLTVRLASVRIHAAIVIETDR